MSVKTGEGQQIDGPLKIFGREEPESPGLSEHPTQGGQMAVRRGGTKSLSQGSTKGLGVLVAESMPGQLLHANAPLGENLRHRGQSRPLGSTGTGSEPGQIDGGRLLVGLGERGWCQFLSRAHWIRIGHRNPLLELSFS
jgi:hypothetical protein